MPPGEGRSRSESSENEKFLNMSRSRAGLRDDVLEGIVLPDRWVPLERDALANAELAFLAGRVHRASLGAGLRASERNRALISCLSLPTRTFAVQAQTLAVAIVWTTWDVALRPDLCFVGTNLVTAIGAHEPDVAYTFPVEAEAVAIAIIRARLHCDVGGLAAAIGAGPAILTQTLSRRVGGNEGTRPVRRAVVRTHRVAAVPVVSAVQRTELRAARAAVAAPAGHAF